MTIVATDFSRVADSSTSPAIAGGAVAAGVVVLAVIVMLVLLRRVRARRPKPHDFAALLAQLPVTGCQGGDER